MSFNSIGYFQFNNLLQNRIPLVLIHLDTIDLKSWFNSVVNMHIENISVMCEPHEALETIKEKKLSPHMAIIVIDFNEQKSPAIVQKLEEEGFINVYYVKGGFQGLSQERLLI